MIQLLKAIYFVCPVVAIGSILLWAVGVAGTWALLLFPICGFGGMFAGGLAKQIEDRKRDKFTLRAGDPVSLARAAFFEVESKGDVPGLRDLKGEMLSLIDDRERTSASILEDKLDPRGLVYLLITNVVIGRLCSGRYHVYRGVLNAQGRELEEAFMLASRRMVQYGVHDERAHDAEVSSLRKELAALG